MQLPTGTEFMAAGYEVADYLVTKAAWPTMTEAEKQRTIEALTKTPGIIPGGPEPTPRPDEPTPPEMGYRLLLVHWVDASRLTNKGWMDLSDIPEVYPHRCVTVGYAVSENEEGKILVPTMADIEHKTNTHVYGGIMIPAGAILAVRELS